MNTELSNFAGRIRFAENRQIPDPEFNTLALDLFALQFKDNGPYQRICEARGVAPENVKHWTQIPSVPTAAFKELELSCLAPHERTAVFHSSGTTEQVPSRHFHCADSLKIYETSLWHWFAPNVINGGNFELLILTPPPILSPRSSLTHMFEIVRRQLRAPKSAFVGGLDDSRPVYRGHDSGRGLQAASTSDSKGTSKRHKCRAPLAVHGASLSFSNTTTITGIPCPAPNWTLNFHAATTSLNNARRPILILGTAFSFVHLLDHLAGQKLQFRLPPNSRVMETGGYKNRSRTLPKTELHRLIASALGISKKDILCEYGMSELSSQAYDTNPERHFRFPPWARVRIISPETENEVADGETGLIRIFDLANIFSVAAIQTEDLAIRHGAGFELIGRAQTAEPRGCSLTTA